MWVGSGICGPMSFVWEHMLDRSERDHDEGECCVGGVEAVAPVDDEPHPSVQSFVTCVVHSEADGGEDAFAPFADGACDGDEGFQSAGDAFEQNRSRSMPTSCSVRSPANTARNASFRA